MSREQRVLEPLTHSHEAVPNPDSRNVSSFSDGEEKRFYECRIITPWERDQRNLWTIESFVLLTTCHSSPRGSFQLNPACALESANRNIGPQLNQKLKFQKTRLWESRPALVQCTPLQRLNSHTARSQRVHGLSHSWTHEVRLHTPRRESFRALLTSPNCKRDRVLRVEH